MIVFFFTYSFNLIIYFRNIIFKTYLFMFSVFYNTLLTFISYSISLEPPIILFSFLTIMNNFIFKDKGLQWTESIFYVNQ